MQGARKQRLQNWTVDNNTQIKHFLRKTEKFKTNVKLDPLTGEFVREEFEFDE